MGLPKIKHNFSSEQLDDWRAYEKVRAEGKYNMFDLRAIAKTGLSRERYFFAMQYYRELYQMAKAEDDHIMQLAERHGH